MSAQLMWKASCCCWWNQGKRHTFLSKTGINPVLPRDFLRVKKYDSRVAHHEIGHGVGRRLPSVVPSRCFSKSWCRNAPPKMLKTWRKRWRRWRAGGQFIHCRFLLSLNDLQFGQNESFSSAMTQRVGARKCGRETHLNLLLLLLLACTSGTQKKHVGRWTGGRESKVARQVNTSWWGQHHFGRRRVWRRPVGI